MTFEKFRISGVVDVIISTLNSNRDIWENKVYIGQGIHKIDYEKMISNFRSNRLLLAFSN